MRRTICAFVILLLSLGPLAATLPASNESRLPICCRRHGAHHCAMSTEITAKLSQASSSFPPAFTSPEHCPYYPGYVAATVGPVQALVFSWPGLPILFAHTHALVANFGAARFGKFHPRTTRGPPTF
jgi:hypothetical protein